jgi:hypothetical protein
MDERKINLRNAKTNVSLDERYQAWNISNKIAVYNKNLTQIYAKMLKSWMLAAFRPLKEDIHNDKH